MQRFTLRTYGISNLEGRPRTGPKADGGGAVKQEEVNYLIKTKTGGVGGRLTSNGVSF